MNTQTGTPPRTFSFTYHGDWWWIAAHITVLLNTTQRAREEQNLARLRWEQDTQPGQMTFKGSTDQGEQVLSLAVSGSEGKTTIQFSDAEPVIGFWQPIIIQVRTVAEQAHKVRRLVAPTTDEVIERYYRARAAGGKVTLKQLAQQYGFNYSYLRAVKSEYDKAGKWGSNVLGEASTGI
jgi:hypothetical protein